jgi:hypothetical protein
MRKSSLFKGEDLEHCTFNPSPNVVSFTDAQRARAPERLQHWMDPNVNPSGKRSRYAPLKAGTRAIAKIKLARHPDGSPNIRESKGARWIDVKFVLEGRYNNRWIVTRFMLAGKSDSCLRERQRTWRLVEAINACHGRDRKSPVSAMEGLRVPVVLSLVNRHGDEKEVNAIGDVLSPNPAHSSHPAYAEFAKTRQVKMVPDPVTGRKRKWIDFPGWPLHPFSSVAQLLQKRLDTYDERQEAAAERAAARMAR